MSVSASTCFLYTLASVSSVNKPLGFVSEVTNIWRWSFMKGFEDACQNFDIKSDCYWALLVDIFRGLTDI